MALWILGFSVAVALLIALVVTVVWMIRAAKRSDREDKARMQSDLDRHNGKDGR
jgi:uncharacterized membrane protein (DUF485 family)